MSFLKNLFGIVNEETVKTNSSSEKKKTNSTSQKSNVNSSNSYPAKSLSDLSNYCSSVRVEGNTIDSATLKNDCKIFYIPYGVERINYMFSNKVLEKIVCPSTLKYIGKRCFSFCEELKEVELNDGLIQIDDEAFSYCKKLEKIRFPKSIQSIGKEAFSNSGLFEAILPDNVKINKTAFKSCNNLFNLRLPSDSSVIYSDNISNYYTKFPKNLWYINTSYKQDFVFSLCGDVYLPKSIKDISGIEFKGCIVYFEGNEEEFELLTKGRIDKPIDVFYNCSYEYESYEDWPRYNNYTQNGLSIYNNVLYSINIKNNSIAIPDGVRWIRYNNNSKVSHIFSLSIPDSLIYLPWFLIKEKLFDYTNLNVFDRIYVTTPKDEYDSLRTVSNIHLKRTKYSDNAVFNRNAPVLAFENDNEKVGLKRIACNGTYCEYIKTPSGKNNKEIELFNNLYIKKLLITKNIEQIILGTNCIQDAYWPLNIKSIDGNTYSRGDVTHIVNLHYEGSEEQWKELINNLDEKTKANNLHIDLLVDNMFFNDYSGIDEYSIDRLKEIEAEIGVVHQLPTEPICEEIKYKKLHSVSKTKTSDSTSKAKQKNNKTVKKKSSTIQKSKEVDEEKLKDIIEETKEIKKFSRSNVKKELKTEKQYKTSEIKVDNNKKDLPNEVIFNQFIYPTNTTTVDKVGLKELKDQEEIVLHDKIEVIEVKSFYEKNIKKINIPKSVKEIQRNAFESTNLYECIIPDNVTLAWDIFGAYNHLSNVRFPADMEKIDTKSLPSLNCKLPKKLKEIYASPSSPGEIVSIYGDIYIPKSLNKINNIIFDICNIYYEGSKSQFDLLVKNNKLDLDKCISIKYDCNYEYESYEDWPRYDLLQIGDCITYNDVLYDVSTNKEILNIPQNIRWISFIHKNISNKNSFKFSGKSVKTINFPDSLIYVPYMFIVSFPNIDYSTLELLKYDYLFIDESIPCNKINISESNIHPRHLKESNRVVFNPNAPVLAFENSNEMLYYSDLKIENTNIQYVKTTLNMYHLQIGGNYHINTLILTPNIGYITFSDEECIKDLYISKKFECFRHLVSKDSVVHIETVHFEGNEEEWSKLIEPFNKVNKRVGTKLYIQVDNVLYNDYSKASIFTIDKLKEIEKEIGLNPKVPKDPIIPIIKYKDIVNNKKANKESEMVGTYDVLNDKFVKPSKDDFEVIVSADKKKIDDEEYKNSNISSIYIPSTCKEIGNSAFSNCKKLEKVYMEEGVQNIGSDAFEMCTSLKTIEIPSTVSVIPLYCFNGCRELTDVFFRGSIKRVMKCAFKETSINEFKYPEGIERIDGHAFDDSELCDVYYPKSVKYIDANACYIYGFDDYVEVEYGGTDDEWDSVSIKRPNEVVLLSKPQKRKKKSITTGHGKTNVKIKVRFDDGKAYYYNCLYGVEVGDDVKVEGSKSGEIGHVVEIAGPWDKYNKYLKEVSEVVTKK